jgi:hypothetical protein
MVKGRTWTVFESRVLRRIFGLKAAEVMGVNSVELNNACHSASIIRVIKFRRMRLAEHVAQMLKRNAYSFLVGEPEGKRPLDRPQVCGLVILRWILER